MQGDDTREVAEEALDRMAGTDEDIRPPAEVDHADYDPVASVLGGDEVESDVALG